MASTFNWTLEYIYDITLPSLNYIVEGAEKFNKKQNDKVKSQSNKSNKFNVNDIGQLRNLPGVKVIKGRKGRLD